MKFGFQLFQVMIAIVKSAQKRLILKNLCKLIHELMADMICYVTAWLIVVLMIMMMMIMIVTIMTVFGDDVGDDR